MPKKVYEPGVASLHKVDFLRVRYAMIERVMRRTKSTVIGAVSMAKIITHIWTMFAHSMKVETDPIVRRWMQLKRFRQFAVALSRSCIILHEFISCSIAP